MYQHIDQPKSFLPQYDHEILHSQLLQKALNLSGNPQEGDVAESELWQGVTDEEAGENLEWHDVGRALSKFHVIQRVGAT